MKLPISLLLLFFIYLLQEVACKPFPVHQRLRRQAQTVIPSTVQDGPSAVEFMSQLEGLDAPKVVPINSTTFDWWYFDAVGQDGKSSVVIVFFTSLPSGFPFLVDLGTVTSVYLTASFPNGTIFAKQLPATSATITSTGNVASGTWDGTGASFEGTPDSGRYLVTIDAEDAGIKGTMELVPTAPAHYPCGPAEAGQTEEVAPHIGWANAIPDSTANIDFTLGTDALQFQGAGYHDKNWSDQPFVASFSSWYWGHGQFGPFSLVWFSLLSPTGDNYISAYVSRSSSPISSTCSATALVVRPIGSDYPPMADSPEPTGFHLSFDMGQEGQLEVDAVSALKIADGGKYRRWVGALNGTFSGGADGGDGQTYDGIALYEEFNLAQEVVAEKC